MEYHISTASIICMGITAVICIAVPLGLMIYLKKAYNAETKAFPIGCAVFFIFVMVLESQVHQLLQGAAFGRVISGSPLYYAIYGGLMAGLFEEIGRYTAFRTVLKNSLGNDANALMYGAGHGGFEAFAIVGLTMINNMSVAIMINKSGIDAFTAGLEGEVLEQTTAQLAQLAELPPWMFLLSAVERLSAIALHMGLSVMVWFAFKKGGKAMKFFPLAVLAHASVDAITVLLSREGVNTIFLEVLIALLSAAVALYAARIWKQCRADQL